VEYAQKIIGFLVCAFLALFLISCSAPDNADNAVEDVTQDGADAMELAATEERKILSPLCLRCFSRVCQLVLKCI
jgi:hypothetical protein